jgi:peptidoglycan/xylan/chitin deacetylase (PgdA/CDA1 family)
LHITNSPFWLQWLYPSLTWHKSREERSVYLTFDDGPVPTVTPFVLTTLRNFDAKATFFCIGDNVRKFPELYAAVRAEGHATGNHTFNHLRGWACTTDEYLSNIQKCSELVHSNLFRPPYGRIKRSQIRSLRTQLPDMEIIMWDVLSGDYNHSISPEKCISNVLKHTRNGSVIVFHDSVKAFPRLKHTLPAVLSYLRAEGFRFKAL